MDFDHETLIDRFRPYASDRPVCAIAEGLFLYLGPDSAQSILATLNDAGYRHVETISMLARNTRAPRFMRRLMSDRLKGSVLCVGPIVPN